VRFIHLPAENRASIILTLVAVATFALICVFISYDAAYQFVASTGLYTTRAAHLYPVLLDIGFLIAETTAINAVLTNRFARNTTIASRFWPHTLMLVNAIGYRAEAAFHHPDLNVGWAQVVVKLQTHSAHGITDKDFALAREIEALATWLPPEGSPLEGFPRNKKWVR